MSLEANKAIIRRLYEGLNTQDLAARLALSDELFARDFVEHTQQLRGLDSMKQFHTQFTEGFPDIHRTIEDIIAEGDKVWVRITYTGTHKGDFFGFAPTGKKGTFTTVHIYRIVDGKVLERESGTYNWLDFYTQLRVIEYKGFPDEVT